jgi:hypothetical protein
MHGALLFDQINAGFSIETHVSKVGGRRALSDCGVQEDFQSWNCWRLLFQPE